VVFGAQALPYGELGSLVADGQGGVSGSSTSSTNGNIQTYSVSGTYSVQNDCSGTMTLTINSVSTSLVNFEVLNGGQGAEMAFSTPSAVIAGRAYRVTEGATQCTSASLSGSLGYLLSGKSGNAVYSQEGHVFSDGQGSLVFTSIVNVNGTAVRIPGNGNYSLSGDCSGTAFVTSQLGNAHYVFGVVQDGRSALFLQTDTGATVYGTAESQDVPATILPDFVYGGGFYSAIYFTNTGSSSVSFPVTFIGDDGNLLSVPSIGSSTMVNLPAGGTTIIEAQNAGPLMQGYASMPLPSGVVTYGVFRKIALGVPDQEVVVPLSSSSYKHVSLTWDETNFVTGVAVVNPSSVATVVSVTARDAAGNVIGTGTLPLAANAKIAVVLRTIPGLEAIAGHRGTANFSVATGNVAVLGLRFSGSVFTSIPTVGK
jgi:hypothetical protein